MKIVAKRNINKYVPPTSQDGNNHLQRSNLVIMSKGEEGTHTELQEGDTAFIKSVYNGLGWIKCLQYLVLGLTHFYETFYFYFAPFIMLIFQFFYVAYYEKQRKFEPLPVVGPEEVPDM